jgi:hypothetical protein
VLCGFGCGGPEKVVTVKGQVTRNGEPVGGLVISFVPEAATLTGPSTGTTDETGHYKLTVAKTGSGGAVVGTHKVWVSLPREPPKPVDKDEKMQKNKLRKKAAPTSATAPSDMAAILKKYGRLDKTPLTVEVGSGEPIDLKLD